MSLCIAYCLKYKIPNSKVIVLLRLAVGKESRDQLLETAVYDARQAVPRPFHHVHLYANQLVLGSLLIPHDDVDLSR